jgi:hypothetical protein
MAILPQRKKAAKRYGLIWETDMAFPKIKIILKFFPKSCNQTDLKSVFIGVRAQKVKGGRQDE